MAELRAVGLKSSHQSDAGRTGQMLEQHGRYGSRGAINNILVFCSYFGIANGGTLLGAWRTISGALTCAGSSHVGAGVAG